MAASIAEVVAGRIDMAIASLASGVAQIKAGRIRGLAVSGSQRSHPHLSFADSVGSVELFNLLLELAPDAGDRHRILADNPRVLYGF